MIPSYTFPVTPQQARALKAQSIAQIIVITSEHLKEFTALFPNKNRLAFRKKIYRTPGKRKKKKLAEVKLAMSIMSSTMQIANIRSQPIPKENTYTFKTTFEE